MPTLLDNSITQLSVWMVPLIATPILPKVLSAYNQNKPWTGILSPLLNCSVLPKWLWTWAILLCNLGHVAYNALPPYRWPRGSPRDLLESKSDQATFLRGEPSLPERAAGPSPPRAPTHHSVLIACPWPEQPSHSISNQVALVFWNLSSLLK